MKKFLIWSTLAVLAISPLLGLTKWSEAHRFVRSLGARAIEAGEAKTDVRALLATASKQLTSDKESFVKSSAQLSTLTGKLRKLQLQKQRREKLKQDDIRVLQYIQKSLRQNGDCIVLSDGVKCERDEVEKDLALYLHRCQDHDAALKRFDDAIASLENGARQAEAAIGQAESQLRNDQRRLESLQASVESYEIRKRIESLIEKCQPASILTAERGFDQTLQEVDLEMAKLESPKTSSAAPWRQYAGVDESQHSVEAQVKSYMQDQRP